MHGSVKTPTFVRLAKEPMAGNTTLVFAEPISGWKAGDHIVIPDTRQLRSNERGANYEPQDENVQITQVSMNQVMLSSPLRHDHRGARNGAGMLEFLPHVGNVTRNVVIRSENPEGTRGHIIFISRANVDMRYVEVRDMGRTKMGVLDNSDFDAAGHPVNSARIKLGDMPFTSIMLSARKPFRRMVISSRLLVMPLTAPRSGASPCTTVITGWSVRTSYTTLAAQGSSRKTGRKASMSSTTTSPCVRKVSGDFAPRSGYGGPTPIQAAKAAGFWFRGPNNYIRNNVAANADAFGFGLAAGSLGTVNIPAYKGADTSQVSETKPLDTTGAAVLEFTNNEAYGAMQAGVAWGWNGTVSNLHVWHTSRHGLTATPADHSSSITSPSVATRTLSLARSKMRQAYGCPTTSQRLSSSGMPIFRECVRASPARFIRNFAPLNPAAETVRSPSKVGISAITSALLLPPSIPEVRRPALPSSGSGA